MLKFWKKKPDDQAPTQNPPHPDPLPGAAVPHAATPALPQDPRALDDARIGDSHAREGDRPASAGEARPSAVAIPGLQSDAWVEDSSRQPSDLSPQPKRSWRERLAKSVLNRDIRTLFARNPKLDDALLDELETALISADVGIAASTALVEDLRRRMEKREFADANALLAALRADLVALLMPVAQPIKVDPEARPFVILMVGVNGVGKTTSIGKIARRLQTQGRSVMLAAGDTFRAAAVEQLKAWGERNDVPVVSQGPGADSASVIFDALQSAKSRDFDVLIADTAGRLHTQTGLMDELTKIRRVLAKLDPDAPHEVLLVIDGTTGQNAINQTRQFRAAIGVTGLVVTKLDGTAKGGVVFALAKEFGLPIRYVGLGETADDLRIFNPTAFVDALLPADLGNGQS
ncbi:MAG TPA: signal recognition particle-docking protein FtsY, partial [Rudaea sp.]|nr:signal recognition particle-docking protein FtsY [Rudaea sp.]